jgi:hypothetical protein
MKCAVTLKSWPEQRSTLKPELEQLEFTLQRALSGTNNYT